MNSRLETLASQRRHLVERSAISRLRLRSDASAVRAAISWNRVPGALATAPAARTLALSLAVAVLGAGRAGRVLLFVSRALVVAKLARAAIGYARARSRPA